MTGPDALDDTKFSLKVQRGEFCVKLRNEVLQLNRELRGRTEALTFRQLQDSYPDFEVVRIFSNKPFDDDDREIICHPRRWDGRWQTYATGILKRHFGTESGHTIRGYLRAYRKANKSSRQQPTP